MPPLGPGTGIGLAPAEKGVRALETWKNFVTHVAWTRARAASTTFVRQAAPNPMNVQRHASVGAYIRYQKGDETNLAVQFIGSLDGVSYAPLSSDDAAASGVSRARPISKTLFPADFADSINRGALVTIAPFDDGILELVSVAHVNFLDVMCLRNGGSGAGAGFITVEFVGGLST